MTDDSVCFALPKLKLTRQLLGRKRNSNFEYVWFLAPQNKP